MEKRSRNRLIVVTAIILALLGILLYTATRGGSNLSYFKTVTELKDDTTLIGKSVRVGGEVVEGTVKKSGSAVSFTLSDKKSTIKIEYDGATPSTFGENVQVIAEGVYKSKNLVVADSLVTKCPSKYENKQIEAQ